MAKMKVHELAKELEIQSKDVVAFLQEKGYEVKAAQSSIDEEQIALVKGKFGKKEEAPAKVAAPKTEVTPAKATVEKPTEKPATEKTPEKKKKTIIFVSNSQNSKMPHGSRPVMANNDRQKPAQPAAPAAKPIQ